MGFPVEPVLGLILKGYPRISETFISNEILLLESLGFKIHIFSMRHPRENFAHPSIAKIKAGVDYLPSTILHHLVPLIIHNSLLLIKRPGPYLKAVRLAVSRWRRTRKSATIKHLLQAGYLVHRLLPKKGVVHFHAHFAHSPTSVALFASILSGLRFSFFAHAKDIYTSDRRQLREKIDMASFVVTCTQYNKAYLLSLSAGLSTCVYCVYHGINPEYFFPPVDMRIPAPPFQLLTVARMTPKKGIDVIYRSLALLKQRGVQFCHTLIGEGDDRLELERLRKTLGIEAQTRLLGTLAHDDVIQWYKKSDLFILGCRIASNGDRDGIPNVMAESMAMKVPVVATRVSGIPELLEQGVTGLMAEPDSPESLADAVQEMLSDRFPRESIAANARKRIEDRFDNRRLIHDLAGIYRSRIPGFGIGN